MSTEDALREYDQCVKKVFSFQIRRWTGTSEKFRASALEAFIKDLVKRQKSSPLLLYYPASQTGKGRCFVYTMPVNQAREPRLLRSYHSNNGRQFAPKITIYEAVRATTAASFRLQPIRLEAGNNVREYFITAGTEHQNPAERLMQEAAAHYGTARRLGCLLSIGTGSPVRVSRVSSGLEKLAQASKGLGKRFGTQPNTEPGMEKTHRCLQAKLGVYPKAYLRFGVPGFHDHLPIKARLRHSATAVYLSQPTVSAQISTAANVLAHNSSEHALTLGLTGKITFDTSFALSKPPS